MVKDISFIGRPHEYDPRRVYSLTGADWQERVNLNGSGETDSQRPRSRWRFTIWELWWFMMEPTFVT